MAIHFGAVGVVKQAQCQRQIFQLGRAAALLFPIDLGKRAGPRQVFELGHARFTKRAVKAGVVGNHQIHIAQQLRNARLVQALALHHGRGDAGNFLNLRRDGDARIFQAVVHLHRTHRQASGAVDIDP